MIGHVKVIGAGISGLTVAWRLAEEGHQVTVIAEKSGADTVSSIAGALWFPYECGPQHRANKLARQTHVWLQQLSMDHPESGVDMIVNFETSRNRSRPGWAGALPRGVPLEWVAQSPVNRLHGGWRFRVPRADPSWFLPWCHALLISKGVRFETRRVHSLPSERKDGSAVVNCCGLEARRLIGDEQLFGILGCLRIVAPGPWDMQLAAADEISTPAYAIPRRSCLVLGGTRIPTALHGVQSADRSIGDRIAADASSAGMRFGGRIADIAGVLPCRPLLRLERDPVDPGIVHNYGHGGSGWTLSWGCASEVARILGERQR